MHVLSWTPFVLLPLAGAIIALTLIVRIWSRRRAPGVWAFQSFLVGVAVWSTVYAFELSVPDLPAKLLWHRFDYVGASLTPAAWVAFALLYTVDVRRFDKRLLALLLIEPLVTQVLVFTNDLHQLMWTAVTLGGQHPPITLDFTYGTGYWVNLMYAYALGILGTVILVRNLALGGLFRRQAAVLVAAAMIPLTGNIVTRLGLTGGLDVTPSVFAVTGLLAFWAFQRLQFLDVTPIARGVVFEGLDQAAIVLDLAGRVMDLNPAAERLTGQTVSTAVGRSAMELFPYLIANLELTQAALSAPLEVAFGVGDDARLYDVHVSALRHRGVESGRLILLADVTDRRQVEDALRDSEEHFRALIEHAADVIAVVDDRGSLRYGSPSLERVLGLVASDVLGKDVCDLMHPEDAPRLRAAMASALADGGPSLAAGCRARRTDGSWRTLDCVVTTGLTRGSDDVIVNMRDVTERKVAEDAVARLALYDDLTGLPNRRLLHDRLDCAIEAGQRDGLPFALLLLDLDRFKEVNDTFGHQAGDTLLHTVATRLDEAVNADTVARLGGDEFAILLTGDGEQDGVDVARRVLELLQQSIEVDGSDVTIGASVGIALYPHDGKDSAALLQHADVAMYQAKQQRGGYAVYAAELDDAASRLQLVGALRTAIAADGLALHFQPKINCRSGGLVGVEALVRWPSTEHGMLMPDQFISIAEQSGVIKSLTRWVLDAALHQCHLWQQAGLRIPVAINLSARDVQDADLPGLTQDLLARWGVPPAWLKLELTESALIADPGQALENLTELCDTGVRVSIDDFGTGYSSFAYLKHLPIHEIKIDRTFVTDLGHRSKDLAIVRSIIELGHNLELETVAEGVEDQATLELLKSLGCDLAQGYWISRPLPAADLARWWEAGPRLLRRSA